MVSKARKVEIKNHDSHSARWLFQVGVDSIEQVDNGIVHSKAGLVGELKGIMKLLGHGPELFHDESFQRLRDVEGQCYGPVVLGVAETQRTGTRHDVFHTMGIF